MGSDESEYGDEEDEIDVCRPMDWAGSTESISTTPSYIIQHSTVRVKFYKFKNSFFFYFC